MFRVSDYLFTPPDVLTGFRALARRGLLYYLVDAAALAGLVLFFHFMAFPGAAAAAWCFILWRWRFPVPRAVDILDLTSLIFLLALVRSVWDASSESLFFLAFTLGMFRWRIDARASIGLALACLIAIPISLALFQSHWWIMGEWWAERLAVWAYYFLAIGVAGQIAALTRAPRTTPRL